MPSIRLSSLLRFPPLLFLILQLLFQVPRAAVAGRPIKDVLAKLTPSFLKKKTYTPLVFFKTPPDVLPECDEMERVVKQVERELGVRVERLDVLRDPAAQVTLNLLTTKAPPFLYHRESLQTVSVEDPESRAKRKKRQNSNSGGKKDKDDVDGPLIDPVQVRAWAKGRYVTPAGVRWGEVKAQAPVVLEKEDNAMDQDELLKEASLTPLQQMGKESMEQRTAEKEAAAKERKR